MTERASNARGPALYRPALHATNTSSSTAEHGYLTVVACDVVVQVAEARVWLEAASSILSGGLLGLNGVELTEAAEQALRLAARAETCIELAVVTQ